MKKILIAAGIVIIFAGYAIYQHMYAAPAVTMPIDNPTQTSQTIPAATSTPDAMDAATSTGSSTATAGATPPTPTPVAITGQYKDGEYTGDVADALYGKIQVKAIVSGGKLTDVQFLQYPNSPGHTIELSQQVMPQLKSEAIAAQSANVNVISGATQDSQAFQESLGVALKMAI